MPALPSKRTFLTAGTVVLTVHRMRPAAFTHMIRLSLFFCVATLSLIGLGSERTRCAADDFLSPSSRQTSSRFSVDSASDDEVVPREGTLLLTAQPLDEGVSQDQDLFPGLPPSPQPAQRGAGDGGSASEKVQALNKAAAGAYRDPFYDNDFSYLSDPYYQGCLLGERFKQLRFPLCDKCATLDLGGQYRLRFQDEINMRGLALTGLDDQFLLRRLRLFANWQVSDNLRVYGEYLGATSDYEDFLPRPIEENPHEIQNLFVDFRLLSDDEGELWARPGRQELLYGSQRLISPLDWANTRRTFDGAKIYYHGEGWDLDGFWTRPIYAEPQSLDSPDGTQEFYALWWTYRGIPDEIVEAYWIGYADYDAPFAAASTFKFQTVGGHWKGEQDQWLAEFEGAYQFGEFGDIGHSAGFFTIGVGRDMKNLPWKPVLWVYYDWASGDDTIGNGFNQLFPLGHKYLGFMDFFARTNIEDFNVLLETKPADQWKGIIWWHVFNLQNGDDVPYRINGLPFVTTPGGSQYLGQELDLLAVWNQTPRISWLFGYSHFFTGDWYRTNPTPPPYTGDADFVYVQWQANF